MLEKTKIRLEIFFMIVILVAGSFLVGLVCYHLLTHPFTITAGGKLLCG